MCPLPPIPRPRSIHGWMHEGAQLTEIRQWKPDSWRAGRNPRAAFRGFAPAQSKKRSPKKGKTHRRPSGLLKEQLRLHIRFKNNVFSPNIHPALLGNRLTSFCPLPPLLGVFSSCSRCVQAGPGSALGQLLMLTNPTPPQGWDRTSCGSDPQPPRRAWSKGRGFGKQRMKMENGQRIPTSFHCSRSVFASAPLLFFFFPSSPSALTQRLSANLRAWHKPYAAPCLRPPGEVLSGLQRLQVFQCYVVAEMILLLFGEREGRVKIPNRFSKLPRSKAKQVSAALRKSC